MRTNRRGLLVISIITLLVLWFLWSWLFTDKQEEHTYNTAVVGRGSIETLVTATGILQPRDYVDVGAQVSGQLKILHVEVGSTVKKGDLLAEIDATVYAANVDSTRAQLAGQQAQLRDREAQLKLAKINYQRQQNLHREDAATREAVDTAEASLASVQAQLDALRAQIKQTESDLRAQEANLSYANIYAPMDGTVVSIESRQGQTLNANQMAPNIMRIADLSVMTVQTQVSEADIGKLQVGMPVYFTTLGSQGRRWYSVLERIQPTPEVLNNVVLYHALFNVPNEEGLLMTNMSTQVFFITSQATDVLLVPMSAVSFGAEAQPDTPRGAKLSAQGVKRTKQAAEAFSSQRSGTVQVTKGAGQQETRDVVIGVTNRIQAEIVSGLTEGEVVVTGVRSLENVSSAQGTRGFHPRMFR